MEADIEVLVICVNYYTDTDTVDYVNSILLQRGAERINIVVVDNNKESVLRGQLPADKRIFVYAPGENLGYYGAASWGLRRYLEVRAMPEWVVVSNTDLKFVQDDFFLRLVEYGKGHQYGVVAPAIVMEGSGEQEIYMQHRPSRIRMWLYTWVYRFYPIWLVYAWMSAMKRRLRAVVKPAYIGQPVQIYAPHGSFIAFRRRYFEAGGSLDYGSFLFNEEIFVAETARRLGLTILYDPRLKLIHMARRAVRSLTSREIVRYQWRSAVYCYERFFKRGTDGG